MSTAVASSSLSDCFSQLNLRDTVPKTIYGSTDSRTNICAIDQLNLDPTLARTIKSQANSVACIMSVSRLTQNSDRSGYSLKSDNYTLADSIARKYFLESVCRNCFLEFREEAKFRDEPVVGMGTAFLVGEQFLLTAGHCVCESGTTMLDEKLSKNYRIVFGFQMIDHQTCKTSFTNDEVYNISAVVAHRMYRTASRSHWIDWSLIKLDRKVVNRAPLKLNLTDQIVNRTTLYMLGHPSGLPLKLAWNAEVDSDRNPDYFVTDLDSFAGNSGSPVFDFNSNEVIGILVGGSPDYQVTKNDEEEEEIDVVHGTNPGEICQRVSTLNFLKVVLPYLEKPLASQQTFGNISAGLNILGICLNESCTTFNQLNMIHIGLGKFRLEKVSATTQCSSCHKNIHPDKVDAIMLGGPCQYSFDGMDRHDERITSEIFTLLAKTSFSLEIKDWYFLDVTILNSQTN